MTRLTKNQHLHRDNQLGRYTVQLGGLDYLAVVDIKSIISTSPTIASPVTTIDGTWTQVATGLSNVLQWKLVEDSGNDFRYAYVAAPGTSFMVGFGWISDNTPLSALYVQRPTSSNITCRLEYRTDRDWET